MTQWTQQLGNGQVREHDGVVIIDPPSAPQPIRRMPIRTKRIDLDGDYAGWHATVRSNAPLETFLKLTQLDTSKGTAVFGDVLDELPALVVGWNFVDEEGEPIPITPGGCRKLPMDLLMALIGGMTPGDEIIPKS